MSNPLRFFLPFGLVRASQMFGDLRALGMGGWNALAAAANPGTNLRLKKSRLGLLPPGALARQKYVIDAGANVGDWALELLRFCQPEKVLVVEPDPRLMAALQTRFKHYPQVELCHVALGAQEGTLPFHQMAQSDMNSLLAPTADAHQTYGGIATVENTIQVRVTTLDAMTADIPRIDLLKLDVQGFEQHVLRGGVETLRRTDAVLLELNFISHYEDDLRFHELDRIMNELGFALSNYSPPARVDRFALWADGLYLRRGATTPTSGILDSSERQAG